MGYPTHPTSLKLNLDGCGFATLVAAINGKPMALNSPIHTRIPTRQRPVTNHLGIYALPLVGSRE
ncbi:hypothetical protein [Chroococcidiopsis sp.]|uniref:hypothetical protein n=1 Tax=Chroococcidiopsis sp. TaxID=3088168 RepID=UPI003F2AF3BA